VAVSLFTSACTSVHHGHPIGLIGQDVRADPNCPSPPTCTQVKETVGRSIDTSPATILEVLKLTKKIRGNNVLVKKTLRTEGKKLLDVNYKFFAKNGEEIIEQYYPFLSFKRKWIVAPDSMRYYFKIGNNSKYVETNVDTKTISDLRDHLLTLL